MINLSRPWCHPFQRQLANRLNQCLLVFSYMGYSHGKCSFVIFIHEKYKLPTVEYITCTGLPFDLCVRKCHANPKSCVSRVIWYAIQTKAGDLVRPPGKYGCLLSIKLPFKE